MITTILIIAAAILLFIYLQNRLAAAKNAVANGYSGIDVQLKRRHDLIPALVDAVRGAISQENRVFDALLEARQTAMHARLSDIETVQKAENGLSAALHAFLAYSEDTPEISSTENVRELQRQLEETEDQISASRRLYNANVERYNTLLDAIPSNWVGRAMGLDHAKPFSLTPAETEAVRTMPEISLPGTRQ
ncbi:LemA family protein [Nitratireductor kimnyeongensis]|uniref:LemA family protein n=1 Tax=Nitratireductor kimnyeongensis TaxID=430679 RepID=A0ABW0TDX2_9HYPH|nr:LemA family protein [Nitratireductor kimnyeongensis]QZZ36899.1 LemA family protein [Nitratireductor kimnyeongensis]